MALVRQELFQGYPFEYWKIISHTWDYVNNQTSGEIALYKDQAWRNEHLTEYLRVQGFQFPGDLTRAEQYAQIKAQAGWEGSVDAL